MIIAAGVERMRQGRRIDVGLTVQAMRDLNRNFVSDVSSLNLQLTTRLRPW